MTDTELINWQAKKIADLEWSLDFWKKEYQDLKDKSIPVRPLTMQDTAPVFAHMEVPHIGR